MGRLLWKELHEVKWYLIGLVLGPWLLTLWPSSTLGYQTQLGCSDLDLSILLLILTFWAATRMPGEMRPNRLTIRSLPVSPWRVWVVKFLPGLVIAILLPLWIHLVAGIRVQLHYDQWDTPAGYMTENFARAASLYTVTFAASLFASSMAAVLAGWFVVFVCIDGIRSYTGPVMEESHIQGMLALIGLFVMLGVWLKARSGGIRRKAAVGALSAVLVLPVGLAVSLAYWCFRTGSLQGATYGLEILSQSWRGAAWSDWAYAYLDDYPSYLISPDGRSVAYTETAWESKQTPRAIGRLKTFDVQSSRKQHLRVWDSRTDKMVIERKNSAPAAWLPDGNLLFVTCASDETINLLEWDSASGRVSKPASFPWSADKANRSPITHVVPNANGTKVALFVTSYRGSGLDLWVLDRMSHRLKLLRPSLVGNYGLGQSHVAWDGDRLVFHYRQCWSILSDGSDLKLVSDVTKETEHG